MNILLTGGHSGIGLELSKQLLQEGHHLGLIVRSENRKKDAVEALGSKENLDFFLADLSKREDIERVISEIVKTWDHIDGLFNNAGVLLDKDYYVENGNEMHFEVNTLTPYYLTKGLLPLLKKADDGFVVSTATGGMHKQKSLNLQNLKKPEKFVKLFGSYLQSKLGMSLLMNYLSKEIPEVRFINVDPGPNKTKMTGGTGVPTWLKPLRNIFFPPPTKGASKLYKAAFDKQFQGESGVYITGNQIRPMQVELTPEQVKDVLA